MMDEYLEESYQSWKQRQRIKGDIVKKRRRRMGDAGELRWAGSGERGGGWWGTAVGGEGRAEEGWHRLGPAREPRWAEDRL